MTARVRTVLFESLRRVSRRFWDGDSTICLRWAIIAVPTEMWWQRLLYMNGTQPTWSMPSLMTIADSTHWWKSSFCLLPSWECCYAISPHEQKR